MLEIKTVYGWGLVIVLNLSVNFVNEISSLVVLAAWNRYLGHGDPLVRFVYVRRFGYSVQCS